MRLRNPGEEVAHLVMLGLESTSDERDRRSDGAHLASRSAGGRVTHDQHRTARLVGDPLADAAERLQPLQPSAADDDEIGGLGFGFEYSQSATVPLLDLGSHSVGYVAIDLITRSRTRC